MIYTSSKQKDLIIYIKFLEFYLCHDKLTHLHAKIFILKNKTIHLRTVDKDNALP